mgnify:CR=1 FL=1
MSDDSYDDIFELVRANINITREEFDRMVEDLLRRHEGLLNRRGAAIVIAKKQPQVRKIYSVEINPECVKYMKENIKINKVEDKILPILGDVRDVCREYYGKCDRVIMPLPKEGYKYLDIALMCIKSGGVIHFYHYSHENDLWYETLSLINRAAIQLNKKIRILQKRKVLPYGPRVWKVCVEFEVT